MRHQNIYDIFDPSTSLVITIQNSKNHAVALETHLGHKNFVRTFDKGCGDYAVKKRCGNRHWYNKTYA